MNSPYKIEDIFIFTKKEATLNSIFVSQGNGNGLSIDRHPKSNNVLYTQDLVNCIAVMVIDDEKCVMIHCDTIDPTGASGKVDSKSVSGEESISLKDALTKFGFTKESKNCTVGIVGGQSLIESQHKQKVIQGLLPEAKANTVAPGGEGDTAYLLSDGFMAPFKSAIKKHLAVENLTFKDVLTSESRSHLTNSYR